MGAVYRARRTLLGDEVAIKIVRGEHSGPGPRDRFFRESRASARLRHPHIVSILDFNVDDDEHPFLVMELLNGLSIKDEIATKGRISARRGAGDRAVALHGAAVRARPRHRPSRSQAGQHRRARVRAGAARLQDRRLRTGQPARERRDAADRAARVPRDDRLRVARAAHGRSSTRASDIYSIGAVVFEMLTGRLPFAGPDAMSMLTAHLHAPVPQLSDTSPMCRRGSTSPSAARSPRIRPSAGRRLPTSDTRCSPETADSTTVIRSGAAQGGLLATYDLGERIGRGRLDSVVYRGTHRALGHPVAIRLLRRDTQRNWEGARARFMREAQALQVAHPSIIQVRDYGEESDFVYLVTDYIEGQSLREVMNAVRSDALAAPGAAPLAARRGDAHAAPAQGPAVRRQSRHHARDDRRRGRAAADFERRRLAGAGPAGDAAGSTRCAASRSPTPSCATPRRSC